MKKILLVLVSIIFSLILYAQQIKVLSTDGYPLAGCVITDGNIVITTDTSGMADISPIPADIITISKQGYMTVIRSRAELRASNYIVRLTPDHLDIESVIISANRWEQSISDVPATIIPIARQNITIFNPQTAADLLGTTGQVYIQKSQLGGGSPMMRGFAANRVLIVVDGVRMNNAIYRSGNLQNVISIDPYNINETEIILGPASNIYGSDALGGVMDFHTKEPLLSATDKVRFNATFALNFWSADMGNASHLDFSYGKRKIAFLTSFSFRNFGDMRMGKNHLPEEFLRKFYVFPTDTGDLIVNNPNAFLQIPSGFSQWYLLQKIKIRTGTYSTLTYAFHNSSTSDIPRYDRLIQMSDTLPKYAQWYYGPQHWIMHNLTFSSDRKRLLADNLRVIAAYQDYTESRHDRKFNNPLLRHRKENVKIYSLNIDLRKQLNKTTDIFYGGEYTFNRVFSSAYVEDIYIDTTAAYAPRYPDGSIYWNTAAYVQIKSFLLNRRLILNAGLRYTITGLSAQFDNSFYEFPFSRIDLRNSALSGSIGYVYKINSALRYKLNFASGFRAPNIDDIGKVFDSEPGKVIVPNPNLKPEYAYTGETGIIFNTEKLFFTITGFYTYLDNAMVRAPFTFNGKDSIYYDGQLSQVQALVNADYANIWGGETEIDLQISRNIVLKNTFTYIGGFDSNDDPLRHVPPSFGTNHLIFNKSNFKTDMFIKWNTNIPYNHLAPSEQDKPHLYAIDANGNPYYQGWWTLNLSIKYRWNRYIFNAMVENIFDRGYRPYSSGISGPGRSINFGLVYQL